MLATVLTTVASEPLVTGLATGIRVVATAVHLVVCPPLLTNPASHAWHSVLAMFTLRLVTTEPTGQMCVTHCVCSWLAKVPTYSPLHVFWHDFICLNNIRNFFTMFL